MATQPAKATAAWPDGSPPRNGVPRPVHAFVARTMKTTRTRATSVMSAGASRTRSRVFVARSPTALWKTRKPIAMAVMEAISTAPAAMSFASFAFGAVAVADEVQQRVHERPAPLFPHDVRADDDVSELARHAVRQLAEPVDREGERVGRLVDAEVLALQCPALVGPDECEP